MTLRGLRALVLASAALAAPAAASAAPMNYLVGSGPKAYPVVALTWWVIVVSVVVVAIIAALVLWGVLARRAGSAFSALGPTPIEAGRSGVNWIVIGVASAAIALVITLVWTVVVLAEVARPAKMPLTIEVTGRQWWWQVRYDNPDPSQVFETANEIHIPVGQPVRFVLHGADVIHSFWVPALSGKTDTIPGQTNETWMQADQPGVYRGQCTEYCGLQHAHMAILVDAEPAAQFEAWRAAQVQPAAAPIGPEASAGEALFVLKCASCHTVRGASEAGGSIAPDLTHLMSRRTIAAGAAPNTPGGLSGWIGNPQGVKPGTKMPTLYLSGPQLAQLRAYLETLK